MAKGGFKSARSAMGIVAKLGLAGLASVFLVLVFAGFAQAASSFRNVSAPGARSLMVPRPTFNISDVTQAEGNIGKTSFVFVVTLFDFLGDPATVKFATADGSATVANNDYQAASGTLTFNSSSSQTVTISVNGDGAFEANETFFVNLSDPTGAFIGDGQGQGTIDNDDAMPILSIDDVKHDEGNSGKTDYVFTVTVLPPAGLPVTVDFATSDASAKVSDNDYQPTSGTLTIPPKTSSGTITVSVNGDPTVETDELFFVDLSNAVNATIAPPGKGKGEVNDDDLVTATLLAVFEANPSDEGVELRWELASDAQISETTLERGDGASGPWAPLTAESRVEGGVTVVVDRSAEVGKSYYYRLSGTFRSGERVVLGTLEGKAGERITEFALKRLFPNPTHGMLRIEYAVPRESQVALRVVDVAGRVVARLVEGAVKPGRYQAVWNGRGEDGSRVGAGMYFVQFKVPGKNLVQRVVVAQ